MNNQRQSDSPKRGVRDSSKREKEWRRAPTSSLLKDSSRPPIREFQVLNPGVMWCVPGDQYSLILKSGCGNDKISVFMGEATRTPFNPEISRFLKNGSTDWKHFACPNDLYENQELLCGPDRFQPPGDFIDGHLRKREALMFTQVPPCVGEDREIFPLEYLGKNIGIENGFIHGSRELP